MELREFLEIKLLYVVMELKGSIFNTGREWEIKKKSNYTYVSCAFFKSKFKWKREIEFKKGRNIITRVCVFKGGRGQIL